MQPTSSTIKPHLLRLSGDDGKIPGFSAERVIEEANAVDLHHPAGPADHVLVIPVKQEAVLYWKTDGKPRDVAFSAGDMVFNPKGNFVAPRWKQDTEFLLFRVSEHLLAQVSEEMESSALASPAPLFGFRDESLRFLSQAIIGFYESSPTSDVLKSEVLVRTLGSHLVSLFQGKSHAHHLGKHILPLRAMHKLDELIRATLHQEIRLEQLAAHVGVSPSHFVFLFRRTTGTSPYHYVMLKRLERAREMLMRSPTTISEIALNCGFYDQSHLTRLMKRHTGLTPLQLRRK